MNEINLIKCDGCEKAFSENLIKHYDNGTMEADLCDNCASAVDAAHESDLI